MKTNSFPKIDSMRKELNWIKNGGFKGIITFSSNGTLSNIPELAKEEGLSVIMGVWDPNNKYEVKMAIIKKHYVDAYCVGHNGLGTLYSYKALKKQ